MKKLKIAAMSVTMLISIGIINTVDACKSGGPGAASCHDAGTVTVLGNSYHYDNSVSCREGYYACCGFGGAHCIATGQKNHKIEEQTDSGPGSEGQ